MNQLALMCPLLSQMKASPVKCRGRECAWWAAPDGCAVAAIANFFQERRFYPDRAAAAK